MRRASRFRRKDGSGSHEPGATIIEFARALDADGALINGLIAALGRKEGSEAIDAFVTYAREQGFAVSRMEVTALRRAVCGDEKQD